MLNLVDQVLPIIKEHKIPGLETGNDTIHPYYNGFSLVNLPGSICKLFNIPNLGAQPLDDMILSKLDGDYENIIFLLADGLKLSLFQEFLNSDPWQAFAQTGLLSPLTSITPSTTATALTTLWTGAHPSEHGVMGYEVWLREYGVIANMILHSAASFYGDVGGLSRAGFDPEAFLPVPTLGPHLKKHGIEPFALQHIAIANSGLSKMLFPGVNVLPFKSNADLFISLEQLIARQQGKRTYAYMYWEAVDSLSHFYGPEDPRPAFEFELFSQGLIRTLKKIRAQSKGKTLFMLTADHGHLSTPEREQYDLVNHPEISKHLTMIPTGENRLPYLFARSGHEEALQSEIKTAFGDDFMLIKS